MFREVLRRPRAPSALEVSGGRRKEPSDVTEALGDQCGVGESPGADAEVEAFLHEVHRARGRKKLDAHLGVSLQIVAYDLAEVRRVRAPVDPEEPASGL